MAYTHTKEHPKHDESSDTVPIAVTLVKASDRRRQRTEATYCSYSFSNRCCWDWKVVTRWQRRSGVVVGGRTTQIGRPGAVATVRPPSASRVSCTRSPRVISRCYRRRRRRRRTTNEHHHVTAQRQPGTAGLRPDDDEKTPRPIRAHGQILTRIKLRNTDAEIVSRAAKRNYRLAVNRIQRTEANKRFTSP